MIIKNEDFIVRINLGPPSNCSDLASEERKFVKVTITAKTAKGQKKLARLNFEDKRFCWVDRSKKSLSIKHYADA